MCFCGRCVRNIAVSSLSTLLFVGIVSCVSETDPGLCEWAAFPCLRELPRECFRTLVPLFFFLFLSFSFFFFLFSPPPESGRRELNPGLCECAAFPCLGKLPRECFRTLVQFVLFLFLFLSFSFFFTRRQKAGGGS